MTAIQKWRGEFREFRIVHRNGRNDALVFSRFDDFEIARHFLRWIGESLFHLQPHHVFVLRSVTRRQAQPLRENRPYRQRQYNVVAFVEQVGSFIQIRNGLNIPGAIGGTGPKKVPAAAGGDNENGFGYGFDI